MRGNLSTGLELHFLNLFEDVLYNVSFFSILPKRTEFERTIIYAVSLGGDTDTIASMAGAIAGAYYGQDSIPQRWRDICEAKAIDDAKRYAKEIHRIVFKN